MNVLTIVAYMGSEYAVDSLVHSLQKQDIFCKEKSEAVFQEIPHIQCIILDATEEETHRDDFMTEESENISFEYVSCAGQTIAQSYNRVLNKIKGEYVAFVDSDCIYSPKAIWHLCEILENDEIEAAVKKCICIKPIFVRPDGLEQVYRIYPEKSGTLDITENTNMMNLCLYSYFIERSVIENLCFDEKFPVESRTMFCIGLLEKTKKYICKNGPSIKYYHALEDAKGLFEGQHHKAWYTKTILECYLPFIQKRGKEKKLLEAVEAVFMYLTYIRFSYNVGASDNEVLSDTEVKEFVKAAGLVCSKLSFDTLLLQNKVKNQKYSSWISWLFIKNKITICQYDYRIYVMDGCVILRVTDEKGTNMRHTLFDFKKAKASISSINFEKEKLIVTLSLGMLPDCVHQLEPEITVTGGCVEKTEIYNEEICFGESIANPTIYRAIIPINLNKDFQQFRFRVKIGDEMVALGCNFAKRPASRLTASCSENYWFFGGNRILQYQVAKNRFVIEKCTFTELMSVEQNYCRAIKLDRMLTDGEKHDIIDLRRDYWKQKCSQNLKKPIWITYDKLYKAGDNGEYIFHYIRKNCPEIDIYYLITENSADYPRLKNDNHVLIHGSKEAKLKVLQAQIILATHTNTMSGCGLNQDGEKRYLKNLYNAHVVCIQHGLTVQDIAIWQNKLCDDTKLYCCASENEVKNISQPSYGYTENEIRLTGLARYDGLVNKDKRQILITPTWRRNLVNAGSSGNVRAKNDFFKESEYFRIYNSLINDGRLIECAKKHHYQIVYLIHPTLSSQINDFDRNEYVDIVAAAGDMSYEKILTESSLMVTDYSGVQFDFAYMRKPVLYYHPASLPPHYTESIAFSYDKMGFGPIIDSHEALVSQICDYMEHNCEIKDFYRKRADEFFAFNDTNNCMRITDAVMNYVESLSSEEFTKIALCDKYDLIQNPQLICWNKILEKPHVRLSNRVINKTKRIVKKIIRKCK